MLLPYFNSLSVSSERSGHDTFGLCEPWGDRLAGDDAQGKSTRELILEVAEEVIAREGIEGMRLRDLAEPIGIRVPSIYAHFRGREDVLTGLAERYIELLAQQFPDDGDPDAMATLERGIRGYARFLAENKAYARLLLRDLAVGGMPEIDKATGGTMVENMEAGPLAPLHKRVSNILKRGARNGQFRPMRIESFSRALVGLALTSLAYPAGASILDGEDQPKKVAEVIDEVAECIRRIVIKL